MKRILAAVMLAPIMAWGGIIAGAEAAGGTIMLTDERSAACGELMQVAKLQHKTGGEDSLGCWNPNPQDGSEVAVIWEGKFIVVYDLNDFKLPKNLKGKDWL